MDCVLKLIIFSVWVTTLDVVSLHEGAFENVNTSMMKRVENDTENKQHYVRPMSAVDIC